MRDAINQELKIGDTVLFKFATGTALLKGTIDEFKTAKEGTKVNIISYAPSEKRNTQHWQRPEAIVKIDLIYEAMPELNV